MTYPVIARLNTHFIGFGDDMWVHYWNNWWVKKTLIEGSDLFSTNLLFYPERTSLLYHNFGWLNIAGWLALEPITEGIAAYNLVYLTNITLCAFTMFLLARYVLKSDGPAFIAGLVHGFWPYRLSDYSHPNTVSTQWLPLVILFTIKLVREKGRLRHTLLLGVSMALTGLSRWQMLIPAGLAVSVYLIFSFFKKPALWSWRTVSMLSVATFVTAVLIAPAFYPIARDLVLHESAASPNLSKPVGTQTDLLTFLVPPINHPLAPLFDGLRYTRWRISKTLEVPKRVPISYFLGYAVLALAVVAIVQRQSESQIWIVLALITLLIALGPRLRINRQAYPTFPMPYRLIGRTLPIRIMRKPHRFNVLLAVPMGMLAAYGATAIKEHLGHRHSIIVWGTLSVLVLFDYVNLPTETIPAHVPDFYHTLASKPGDFALAGLPGDRQGAELYMFYQTVHGHPLMTGHISRLPPNALDFVSSVPLTEDIYRKGKINTELQDVSRQLSQLADAGIRYIILHKNMASPEQIEEWRAYLAIPPWHEDNDVVVYPTAPQVGQGRTLKHELGAGIGLIRSNLSTHTVAPDAMLEIHVVWGAKEPPTSDLQVEIALADDDTTEQAQRFDISNQWPTSEWPADTIVSDHYTFQIEPWVTQGEQDVTMQLIRSSDGKPVGRQAVVGRVIMEAPKRCFTAPSVEQKVEVDFGDVLQLVGYDLSLDEDTVTVVLHWKALRRMETSYKFFVHLQDTASSRIVAQADIMPHGWKYPTVWWEAGEFVSDDIVLLLDGVPPGAYQLWVGAYHPNTGERLTITGTKSSLTVDNARLQLAETTIRSK
jgi:hypothetical protein